MPSKLLIAAAEAAHGIERARGVRRARGSACASTAREVMARVKRERDRFVGFMVRDTEAISPAERIHGRARFVGEHTLAVEGGPAIRARSVVIATGSRPSVPPILADIGNRLVVNDDVFEWDDLPRSVAVLGPGVIGLELGQALARLGVRVVVLGRGGRVGPLTDPAVRAAAVEAFCGDFELDPDAHVARVERVGEQVELEYHRRDGTPRVERFDYVLAATGRVPNVDGLGLETTGLARDARGVPVYDRLTMQAGAAPSSSPATRPTTGPSCTKPPTRAASPAAMPRATPTCGPACAVRCSAVVFTDPQIAIVGGGYAHLHAQGLAAGEVAFENQGRARVMLRNRGKLRVYGDPAAGRFLGAEMAGPDAEHIGHLLAWALQAGMTIAQMLDDAVLPPGNRRGIAHGAARPRHAATRSARRRRDPRTRPARGSPRGSAARTRAGCR